MNIVKLSSLKESMAPGQKSPILILDSKYSASKGTLYIEDIAQLVKAHNNEVLMGNSVWLRSDTELKVRYYNTIELAANTCTNIVKYKYGESYGADDTTIVPYNPNNAYITINYSFATTPPSAPDVFPESDIDESTTASSATTETYVASNVTLHDYQKECHLFNVNAIPTDIVIGEGIVTGLDVNASPSVNRISCIGTASFGGKQVVDGEEITSWFEILNLCGLPNLEYIASPYNTNYIRLIMVYNYQLKQLFTFVNLSRFVIYNKETDNVTDIINGTTAYTENVPYYIINYTAESFSQEELDLAAAKNITLVKINAE